MNRPVVEFPLFYGDEREDVREFLGNYRRAGLLNGWDEEKLALGLPLFLKKHASVWFKTLTEADKNESFQVLSQKLISHFESKVTLWQLRQKLEERRQLLGETVADYYYDILSFCSRLNLPKSEWLYCFVRGLRPEIREHVILQQPPDLESALNIAKLKELVTLCRKSSNGQEVENFEELQSNPSEEEVKQSVGEESNVWSTDVQNNGNRRINRKFRSGKLNRFRYGGSVFSKNPKLGSYGSSKPNFRGLYRRNNMQNAFHQGKMGAQLNWLAPLSCVVVNP